LSHKSRLMDTRFKIRPLLSAIIIIVILILLQGVNYFWLRVAGVTLVAMGLFLVIQKLAAERRRLLNVAILDELTGLGNFRAYQERMRFETQRAQRKHEKLTLILVDLDQFKKYNDSHGHRLGNELLHSAAQIFKGAVRSIDGVYRFGGDEFAIVLPETNLNQAWHIAKRIRHSFGSLTERAEVTLSMGMSIYQEEPLHEFFDRVDHLLYEVKANGGNGCQSELRGSNAPRKAVSMNAL